jgi:hypothetical protein
MRAAIPGAELKVFPHSRHGLPLSHGRACAQVMAEFLDRHSPECNLKELKVNYLEPR